MKKLALLLFILCYFKTSNLNAQNLIAEKVQEEYPNYIKKGNFSVSAAFSKINRTSAFQNTYETYGGEVGALYYLLHRVGLETTVSGHQYSLQKAKTAEAALLNNKNLLLISERLRFNFWEKSHCGTTFLQTGYSFGDFQQVNLINIHRWEIISLGVQSSFPRKLLPFVDYEGTIGITKDNLHKAITWQFKMGLRYNFGH